MNAAISRVIAAIVMAFTRRERNELRSRRSVSSGMQHASTVSIAGRPRPLPAGRSTANWLLVVTEIVTVVALLPAAMVVGVIVAVALLGKPLSANVIGATNVWPMLGAMGTVNWALVPPVTGAAVVPPLAFSWKSCTVSVDAVDVLTAKLLVPV